MSKKLSQHYDLIKQINTNYINQLNNHKENHERYLNVEQQRYHSNIINLNTMYESLINYSLIEYLPITSVNSQELKSHFNNITQSLNRPLLIWIDDYATRYHYWTINLPNKVYLNPLHAPLLLTAERRSGIYQLTSPYRKDRPEFLVEAVIGATRNLYRIHNQEIYESWKHQLATNPDMRHALKLEAL